MSELRNILENFCRLEGVRGALVVRADGAVHDSVASSPIDADKIALLIKGCTVLGERTAVALNLASVSQLYFEFEDFSVTSETIGRRSLVIVANPGANLGRIRLEIRKNSKNIEGAT